MLALLVVAPAAGWGAAKRAAIGDTLRSLPRLRTERRAIQARRAVSAAEFARLLRPELASPYLGAIGRNAALRAALRVYWRAVLAIVGSARKSRSADST